MGDPIAEKIFHIKSGLHADMSVEDIETLRAFVGREKPPLSLPYSTDEVWEFERKLGQKLPPLLFFYLTRVSREIKTRYKPVHVSLDIDSYKPNCAHARRRSIGYLFDEYGDINICDDGEDKDQTDGCIKIGDTGCYFLFLVVKGDDVGLVFSYDSDGMYFEVGNIEDIIEEQLVEPKDSC